MRMWRRIVSRLLPWNGKEDEGNDKQGETRSNVVEEGGGEDTNTEARRPGIKRMFADVFRGVRWVSRKRMRPQETQGSGEEVAGPGEGIGSGHIVDRMEVEIKGPQEGETTRHRVTFRRIMTAFLMGKDDGQGAGLATCRGEKGDWELWEVEERVGRGKESSIEGSMSETASCDVESNSSKKTPLLSVAKFKGFAPTLNEEGDRIVLFSVKLDAESIQRIVKVTRKFSEFMKTLLSQVKKGTVTFGHLETCMAGLFRNTHMSLLSAILKDDDRERGVEWMLKVEEDVSNKTAVLVLDISYGNGVARISFERSLGSILRLLARDMNDRRNQKVEEEEEDEDEEEESEEEGAEMTDETDAVVMEGTHTKKECSCSKEEGASMPVVEEEEEEEEEKSMPQQLVVSKKEEALSSIFLKQTLSLYDIKCSKMTKRFLLDRLRQEANVLRLLFDNRPEIGSKKPAVRMRGNAQAFVSEMLKREVTPSCAIDRMQSLLMWSLSNGLLDVADLILEKATPLSDAPDRKWLPSFFYALVVQDPQRPGDMSREVRKEAVKLLLRHGADPNPMDDEREESPLSIAIMQTAIEEDPEDVSLLTLLIDGGANVNMHRLGTSPLYLAVDSEMVTISKALLDHGADPNAAVSGNGATPLGSACRHGHLVLVQELLKKGASVNVPSMGASPLIWAVFSRKVEVVRLLLERGADVNTSTTSEVIVDRVGTKHITPLVLAVVTCGVDVVKALLSAGADVQCSPLFYAVRWRKKGLLDLAIEKQIPEGFPDVDILTELLEKGADCNEVCCEGVTVLVWAVMTKNLEAVKVLLKRGADPNVNGNPHDANTDSDTPLGFAIPLGLLDIVTELINGGADVNLCSKGASPLLLAMRYERVELVAVLLERGADPNVRVCNKADAIAVIPPGETGVPLLWNFMCFHRSPEIAGLFLKYGADITYRQGAKSLLTLACLHRDLATATDLLARGLKPSDDNSLVLTCSCFHQLIEENSSDANAILRMLVEHGADVNQRDGITTPLEYLTYVVPIPEEAVLCLLENGANPAPLDEGLKDCVLLRYFSYVIYRINLDGKITNPDTLVKVVISDKIIAHLVKRDAGLFLISQIEAWFRSDNGSFSPSMVPLCLFALAYHTPQVFEQQLAVLWSFLEAKLWSRSAAKGLVLHVLWALGRASGLAKQAEHPNESSARLASRFMETVCNQTIVEYLIQMISDVSEEKLVWLDWSIAVGMTSIWQAVLRRETCSMLYSHIRIWREEAMLPQLLAQTDMKKLHRGLEVEFSNEPGAGDALRRELFVLAANELKASGLFESVDGGRTFRPRHSAVHAVPNHIDLLTLTGNLMWLALCYGEPFPLRLSFPLLKCLVMSPIHVQDLDLVDHELYTNLVWIRSITDPDELSRLDLNFTIISSNHDVLGEGISVKELKPEGRGIAVTMENREEYISSYATERLLGGAIREVDAFLTGFLFCQTLDTRRDITGYVTPAQLDVLIAGQQTINVREWEGSTKYEGGLNVLSDVVMWFWEMVRGMDDSQRAALLCFATGSCSVPAGGFACLSGYEGRLSPFCISKKEGGVSTLPSARVCFNTLCLPEYPSKEVLETRLLFAVKEGSNQFGIV